MPNLPIKKYPDSILRKKARRIKAVDEGEKKIFDDMIETMYATSGIGLAAPQVGLSKNIAVVDAGEGLIKMINPKIVSKKGNSSLEEGCLSVPAKCVNVRRAEEIVLSYTDEKGVPCKKTFRGLTARAIQHEIDHLEGKLIIDYLPWYKRILTRPRGDLT